MAVVNSSAYDGILQPIENDANPAPLEDDPLMDLFQGIIVVLAGLPGNMVRPRWQAQEPNLPNQATSWAAFGVTRRIGDFAPYVKHHPEPMDPGQPQDDGWDELHRHEEMDLLVSFYGPQADRRASLLRDGLGIQQNRDQLFAVGMGLIEITEALAVPLQINNIWYYRVDITVRVRREIVRAYKVLNLLSFQGTLASAVINIQMEK